MAGGTGILEAGIVMRVNCDRRWRLFSSMLVTCSVLVNSCKNLVLDELIIVLSYGCWILADLLRSTAGKVMPCS